jgi:UDP-N-acetylglucosamine 2-epimerase (non-hydrolysing)
LLLLRNVTERPEAFNAGLAKIVGTRKEKIVEESENLLNDAGLYAKMTDSSNPYGDGRASDRIVKALMQWSKGKRPLLNPSEEFNPWTAKDLTQCQKP